MNIKTPPISVELQKTNEQLEKEIIERQKAEEEIKHSLSLLNATLESTADGILVVDREGKIEKFNRKFVQMWQVPESILVSRNDDQVLAFVLDQLKYPQSFLAKVRELYADPEADSFDVLEFKDGRVIERYSQPQRIGDQIIGRVWSFRDVTERKQFEEKLHESEEYYRQLINISPEGITTTDQQGRLTFVSPKIYNIFDIPPGVPVIGTSVLEWIHPEHQDIAMDRIRKLVAKEISPSPFEYKLLKYNRTPFWGELSSTPLIDAKGQTKGIMTIIRDTTERTSMEDDLHKSEERFRNLYNGAPVGYHEYDLEGRITNVNHTDLEMLGYTREEMIGKFIWDFNIGEETVRQQVLAKLSCKLPPGRNLERIYRRKDGTAFPVLIEDRLIQDEKGQIKGIRCTIQDITERKRTEELLRRSEGEAKRLAQENEIMAGIGRIVSSTLNIEEIYDRFAEEVRKLIPFDRIVINGINIEKGTLTNIYIAGQGIQDRKVGEVYPLQGSGNAEMVRTSSTLLVQTEDFNEYKDLFPMLLSTFQAGFRSIMNVPLFSKGKIIGGLLWRSLKPYAYTDKEVKLAEKIGNQIAGAIANAQLMTEQKRIESTLRESEDRYRDLVEYSQFLICTHDLEGKILSTNQWPAKILGYKQSDLLGMNIKELLAPEGKNKFDEYIETIRQQGSAKGLLLVQPRTGEKRIWEYNNTLRTEGVPEPIVRGMAHDITDLKRIEREREKLILDLKKALSEVKKLSGLLPICASCKKIRDDQGYWNQIETYIRDHSEAEFSHGICPDCFKKLYPDIEI